MYINIIIFREWWSDLQYGDLEHWITLNQNWYHCWVYYIIRCSLSETCQGWKFVLTPLSSLWPVSHEVTLEILPKLQFFVAIELSQDEFLHVSRLYSLLDESRLHLIVNNWRGLTKLWELVSNPFVFVYSYNKICSIQFKIRCYLIFAGYINILKDFQF